MNVAAAVGACSAPLVIGALTKANAHTGWRNFYVRVPRIAGYYISHDIFSGFKWLYGERPPSAFSSVINHQSDTITSTTCLSGKKLARLDILGFILLTAGLTLFLTGLNSGGGLYPWASAPVLATLIIGLLCLVAFGVYEWRFTKTGILHHDLFRGGRDRGRTFAISVGLIFIEGILLFSCVIFYPVL